MHANHKEEAIFPADCSDTISTNKLVPFRISTLLSFGSLKASHAKVQQLFNRNLPHPRLDNFTISYNFNELPNLQ